MSPKRSLDQLVLFGGSPMFATPLHVGRPNIGDRSRLQARISDMLDRRWLANYGPYVREFERRVADHAGVKHCIATCNATVGLQVAVRALELRGEVILPAFTFIATAHALRWEGLSPVFCDIDPLTHNIDPWRAARLITPRTTAILGVHLWGRPCDVGALARLARAHGLKLLFDAAHAFGCAWNGRPIGGLGDLEVFSFHATKCMGSGEGGAMVTNNDVLARRLRLMINFGFASHDRVVCLGTNGKMSELAAAMGLTSLESFDEFARVNRRNHGRYARGLAGIPGLCLARYDDAERSNYHYVVVEVDEAQAGLSRDELQAVLWSENVLARRYFYPGCHRMEPYASECPNPTLAATDRLASRVLCLPNGTAVGPDDVEAVCSLIRLACADGDRVRERLRLSALVAVGGAR